MSFKKDAIRGQTLTMLPATSNREGIERSPDTTARLKASRDAIQSLCSATFSLTLMNSVIENRSKLSKTTEAHFWRYLLWNRESKMVYSNIFSRYSLPVNSTCVSRSTCEPPTKAISDTEGPTTLRSCPRTAVSRLASPLYLLSKATHTIRNASRSHVRTKTRVTSDPSSNSTLNWSPWSQPSASGYIPISEIVCKRDITNENVEQIRNFPEGKRNIPEPVRIYYGKDTDTNQSFITWPADFVVHTAGGQGDCAQNCSTSS